MCIFCVNFARPLGWSGGKIKHTDRRCVISFTLPRRIHFEKTCNAEEKTNKGVDEAVLIFFDNFILHF